MTETVDTWVMKSVKPTRSGWYMTWTEHEPEYVYPRFFVITADMWALDPLCLYPDFDMWCRQPIPPDVKSYHQLRAILAAKSN